MSDNMTNLEYLESKGALNREDITEEHEASINNDFTREEMDTLIKMKQKIKGEKFSSGAAF